MPRIFLSSPQNQPIETALGNLPLRNPELLDGIDVIGNGACTQSVKITSPANGGNPRVVSRSSGNCGSAPGFAGVIRTRTASAHRPDILETHGTEPYGGLIGEAAWRR